VVGRDGRLRAANAGFVARIGERMIEGPLGLRFANPFLQAQFAAALERHRAECGAVQSVAVHDADGGPPFAVHLLPIKGAARELCETDGVLLLIADGSNLCVPDADLLRLLFDLTPAEARLTRLIAQGHAVADASRCLAITEATARVHLKSIFLKTGVTRQAELVRLLMGLGMPAID
jgi:DNA-binding CsgD family transcriptional regulator